MKKIIGIIGGMGPLATADLFEKIIRATDAARDQDFPHVIVDCVASAMVKESCATTR